VSALAKRSSRTVKYCAPWSKLPKDELRVLMRPPALWLFSNTVTWWPACTRVRAQAMPAMPAPMTAKCLALGFDADFDVDLGGDAEGREGLEGREVVEAEAKG
jgi:hypothetical protein